MSILYAADAVQSIARLEVFEDVAAILKFLWRIICRIARIIAFIGAMFFGAAAVLVPCAIFIHFWVGD